MQVHEQVQKQLDYLKIWVDAEKHDEELSKKLGISHTPCRRKWIDIANYEAYKKEIEKNGDKNLLVMVDMDSVDKVCITGVKPFARRYVNDYDLLVHRTGTAEILVKRSEVKVVNM